MAGTRLTVEFQMPGAWVWFCLRKPSKVPELWSDRIRCVFSGDNSRSRVLSTKPHSFILSLCGWWFLNPSTRNCICLSDFTHIPANCPSLPLSVCVTVSLCIHTCVHAHTHTHHMGGGHNLAEDWSWLPAVQPLAYDSCDLCFSHTWAVMEQDGDTEKQDHLFTNTLGFTPFPGNMICDFSFKFQRHRQPLLLLIQWVFIKLMLWASALVPGVSWRSVFFCSY